MKIYMFIALMGVGGAERVCVSLANEFAKMGHEVHIVVLNLSNDVNTHLLDKRCQVHELGVSRLRYAALPMVRFIKKHKPEAMLVFGNEMGIITGHLRKLHLVRTKVVLRVLNNVNISLSKEDNISPVVEAYLQKQQKQMGSMEAVITQCQAMGQMLLEKKLVTKEKLNCIYNPVSKGIVESVRREQKENGCRTGVVSTEQPRYEEDNCLYRQTRPSETAGASVGSICHCKRKTFRSNTAACRRRCFKTKAEGESERAVLN